MREGETIEPAARRAHCLSPTYTRGESPFAVYAGMRTSTVPRTLLPLRHYRLATRTSNVVGRWPAPSLRIVHYTCCTILEVGVSSMI